MKRVIGIILCIAVLICSPVTYYGQETEDDIYKTIAVEFSDNIGGTEAIQLMIEDDNVYVNAEQIGQRLGYSVQVGDGYVSIYNKKTSDTIPYGATRFNFDSFEISHMLFNQSIKYEAEFESRKNEQGAWIPFQQSLLLLNSSVLVVDNKFLIEMPHKNIIDIFMDITKNSNTYLFDWNKDFGYTDTDWKVVGTASHMVNVLNGFLDFDGASWAQLVQTFMLSNDAYDDKYGQAIAKLFCTYSDKELSEQVEEMKAVMQHFDGSGTFGKTLEALEKEIPTDVEIRKLQETCESLENEIYAGNGDVAKYNISYQILEKAVDKSNRFDDAVGGILEAQKTIGGITGKLYKLAEVVGYASEFSNQDKFAVDALDSFVSKVDSSDTMSNQMKNSIKNYDELLKSDIVTYSALTWLQNNYDTYIFKAADLKSEHGTESSLILVAWDFAKDLNVLGIGDKIDAADKFELAVYASIFQSDAFVNYQEVREQTFSDEGNITPENLYNVTQLCYAYLKSCYITRDAAIASLKAKTAGVQEQIQPLIDEQNAINQSIAKNLIKLKNANKDNSELCYGFLPADNESFLRENATSPLIESILNPATAENVTFERMYEDNLEYAIIKGVDSEGTKIWEYDTGKYEIATLDSVNEIGISGDRYYFVENGSVICMELQTGNIIWQNSDFQGSVSGYIFNDNEVLFLCGYFGPDFYAIDGNGNTLALIYEFDESYYWPYEISIEGDYAVVKMEGSSNGEMAEFEVNVNDYTYAKIEKNNTDEALTDDELCELARAYYEKTTSNLAPEGVGIDGEDGDMVDIWLYVDMADHSVTVNRYTVNRYTGEGTDMQGMWVSLKDAMH